MHGDDARVVFAAQRPVEAEGHVRELRKCGDDVSRDLFAVRATRFHRNRLAQREQPRAFGLAPLLHILGNRHRSLSCIMRV